MKIIREYCLQSNTCVVRTETYACSFDHARQLVQAAREDFSGLAGVDVQIKIYGGDRHKGQMGIEFTPYLPVPMRYQLINELETAVN